MWTDLFFDNRECLLNEVTTLIDNLKEYQKALADSDREKMISLLRDGRVLKEENLKKHGRL